MPALIGGRDVQAPVLCGCGCTDRKTFDILHPILVCDKHFLYPVTDELLHAAPPLQVYIEKHIRIQQFHQRLIGNSLQLFGFIRAIPDLCHDSGILLIPTADADIVLLFHTGQGKHCHGIAV
jgi:hypothetical protein